MPAPKLVVVATLLTLSPTLPPTLIELGLSLMTMTIGAASPLLSDGSTTAPVATDCTTRSTPPRAARPWACAPAAVANEALRLSFTVKGEPIWANAFITSALQGAAMFCLQKKGPHWRGPRGRRAVIDRRWRPRRS